MNLNSKNNQFVFYFPPTFWDPKIVNQYKDFQNQLMLPYDTLDDYILSTLHSISFPSLKIGTAQQTRNRGAEQDYKGAGPIKDSMDRKFSLSFKAVEGYTNYMILWHNMLNYLDFNNKTQYFDQMILGVLNNEGFLMQTITFKKVILTGISGFDLNYSSVDPTFNKLTVDFIFNDWDINVCFDKMINLYKS